MTREGTAAPAPLVTTEGGETVTTAGWGNSHDCRVGDIATIADWGK